MKIIFFGSAQFAVPSLGALLDAGYDISSVVTQPDKAKGRGLHLEGTPVKLLAQEAGLKIYQPNDVNSTQAVELLKKLGPDLFVVIAYGQILAQRIIDIPKLMVLNAHASLLPKYRGAAPINWAIINGERQTGVTIMKVVRKMDAGPIILQDKLNIEEGDTECTLERKLAQAAAKLSVKSIKALKAGDIKLSPQDDSEATYAPKLKKVNGLINWGSSAQEIHNLIRGVCGWPGAFTYYHGKLIKIYEAQEGLSPKRAVSKVSAGEVLSFSKEGILIACGQGNLLIKQLQPEGKRRMLASEFITGYRVSEGDFLAKR